MVESYRARRDLLVEILAAEGVLLTTPRGAFYAMVDVSSTAHDSRAFALRLLRERGVALAPGGTFGESASSAVRISLASAPEALAAGVRRLVGMLHDG
jgi:aspartate/methionine/tyrosine aminotransferase